MTDPIHRLELDFEGGSLAAKLVCPDTGCQPAGYCSECGRERDDTEKEPCDCCTADDAIYCNAYEWFSAAFDESWLLGSTTVDVEVDWESGEGPTFTILDSVEARIRADQTERIIEWAKANYSGLTGPFDAIIAAITREFGGIDKGERDDRARAPE